MITIYGRVYSRAPRVLWAAEEIGVSYEHVSVDHKTDEVSQLEFLAMNPNGKIPVMVDGDVTLFESMATKYGEDLLPNSAHDHARALQWTFWGVSEIESKILDMFVELIRKLPADRSRANIDAARTELGRMLVVLEGALSDRNYFLEDRFTLADLNLASIFALCKFIGPALADLLDAYPNVRGWLDDRCLARPAYKKVMAMEPPPADLLHLHAAAS
jgi:glutathione S-transferase